MSALHIRGIHEQTLAKLKVESEVQGMSMNAMVVRLIEQGIGISHARKKLKHHDLDQYAGSWTTKEAKSFLNRIADFEKIDQELWQ